MDVVAVGSRASVVAAVDALVREQDAAVLAVDVALGECERPEALHLGVEDAGVVEAGAGSH